MEATEIAEQIHGEHHHGRPHTTAGDEKLRKLAGIYVGVVAVLLAIASLGGTRAMKEMLNANVHAADTYAFYQAKYNRQTAYRIAATQLEFDLAARADVPEAVKTKAAAAVKQYRTTADRYENDAKKNDGKQQLLGQAMAWEAARDHARAQDPNFELAEALFQISIVLGSVSIVAASPALLTFGGVIAAFATLLTLNGYFLFLPLPLG